MGKHTDYDLRGWKPNGGYLSAFEKEEIQDMLFDEGVDDYGCSHKNDEPEIMSFSGESFFTYDNVRKALSGYARSNPTILLELEYACEDDNDHQMIRFRGNEFEEYNRFEAYPAFFRLTLPNETNQLPVLEFHFESTDDRPDSTILVLLESKPTEDMLLELEDSISSYTEKPAWEYEQMIHDTLAAEGIGHWIIKPVYTFNV